ncbi:MAG: hypothetical protein HOV78_32435, partial [Hamadaea sp.]|nr:hypothetical protein [Hamadaea sp.]
ALIGALVLAVFLRPAADSSPAVAPAGADPAPAPAPPDPAPAATLSRRS